MSKETSLVDSMGNGWFPRPGDRIKHHQMMRSGFVVAVRQTGNAPATVTVVLEQDSGDPASEPWQSFNCEVYEITRDTSGDVEPRSLSEIAETMTVDGAARLVLEDLPRLAAMRSTLHNADDLVGALLMAAENAAFLSSARAARFEFQKAGMAANEADRLRELASAVQLILRSGPIAG